jgi:hypothetical protein
VPGKEPGVGAHRGGGEMVWWRGDLGATGVSSGGSSDGCRRSSEVRLWLCDCLGQVGRRERGGSSHLGEGTVLVAWPNSR